MQKIQQLCHGKRNHLIEETKEADADDQSTLRLIKKQVNHKHIQMM